METNQWSSKKKIESAAEALQGSSRRNRGQARIVPPGNGIRPERARKSLSEKLETVALNSPKKDPRVNLYDDEKGVADEIFLKDEETGLGYGDSSPFCGVSDKLLQRIELLGRDHEAKRLDSYSFRATEAKKERQKESEDNDLIEMKRKVHTLSMENSQLKKSLVAKEEFAVSLQERKSQVESEFETLMSRLDSTEKENAFLRYEYTVLEKDFQAKREEAEYTRKSIELTHKQQLRNVNKIVELEAECKRLRLLFRKKFPEKSISMRNEGEEKKMEIRRRNANKSDMMMRDEVQSRKLKYDLLMEQIGNVRAENKNLMDIIMKKNMEIKDLSRGQKPLAVSSFDIRSETSVMSSSCSKEMKLLMDDFNEMEKLAIVCTEKDSREDDEKDGNFDWIQVVLSAISKQERISKRGVKELLQDIKIALGCMDNDSEIKKPEEDPLCITWKSPNESSPMTKDEIKRHLGLTPEGKAEKTESNEKQELRDKLEESEEKIRNLEAEVKALRESKETIEAEMETEKLMKEDLDTKLNITRANLNETQKKLSSLEVELDYKMSCCEELEGTCIELQLQLESVEMKKPMQRNKYGLDIAKASAKLSECQETITNLRKQLRALSTTETSNTGKFLHRRSQRDNIEESTAKDSSNKAETEDNINRITPNDDDCKNYNALIVYEPVKSKSEKMEMIQRKKQGLGFLKKLMFRRKRVSSKKCLALTM